MKRFAILALVLVGCGASKQAVRAPSDMAEEQASALPRGRLPQYSETDVPASNNATPTERLGISVLTTPQNVSVITSFAELPYNFGSETFTDPPNVRSAFCVKTKSNTGREQLPTFISEMEDNITHVYAERVEDGKFHALTAVLDKSGRAMKVEEEVIPMKRVATSGGVDVFAFQTDKAIQIVVQRPEATRGRISGASFAVLPSEGSPTSTWCQHVRVELPTKRGDGGTAIVDLGVETLYGARAMRVSASTMWLQDDRNPRLTARMGWSGEERDRVNVSDARRIVD